MPANIGTSAVELSIPTDRGRLVVDIDVLYSYQHNNITIMEDNIMAKNNKSGSATTIDTTATEMPSVPDNFLVPGDNTEDVSSAPNTHTIPLVTAPATNVGGHSCVNTVLGMAERAIGVVKDNPKKLYVGLALLLCLGVKQYMMNKKTKASK